MPCLHICYIFTCLTLENALAADLPYAPSNVRISEITATSVHISWHYDGPPSEAVEFVIQYKPKLAPGADYAEVVGLKTNYYTVQSLNPFTEYEFYVIAVSGIGRGLASTAVFVTTGETGNASWRRRRSRALLTAFSFD